MREIPSRLWPAIAAGLIIVSLGMPWIFVSGTDSTYVPGWFVPGFCTTVYDLDGWAFSECTQGVVNPGLYLPGTNGSTGAGLEHTGRFGLAWALVMIAMAHRTGHKRYLLWGGVGLGLVTGLSTGTGVVTSGVTLAWVASAILIGTGSDGALRPRLTALVQRVVG